MITSYTGLQGCGMSHDEKIIFIYYYHSCPNDIEFLCKIRTLDFEEFMMVYKSYESYCLEQKRIEDDCDRFMFQFQYRYNELISKKPVF